MLYGAAYAKAMAELNVLAECRPGGHHGTDRMTGKRTWVRLMWAIEELERIKPAPGEAPH